MVEQPPASAPDPDKPSSTPTPPAMPVAEAPKRGGAQVAAVPFDGDELRATLLRPLRMLDVVLGERRRLVANVRGAHQLRVLVAALLTCSVLFAVPFALVDGFSRLAHVAILFLGTSLLCFPSLQVFCAYLGVKLHPAQNLAIVMLIPAAAAAFTLGFAPIYWFLDLTLPDDGGLGGTPMRVTLLVASLVLALCHLNRCLFTDMNIKALRDNWLLWAGWQLLFVFLSYRMATTLGLFE